MTSASETRNSHSVAFIIYLIVTAAACGSLVMVIEVLGSRVIGPFFGVSLFVWTSLITVTLVALALGYAAGGLMSDKKSSPSYLYGIIFAAGVLTLFIPYLKGGVLKACVTLGLRIGALTSASVLFGPPLFLLGCVSPYIIKIAAGEMKNIGRTVGIFYAISTIGSFIGTVLTGFVLIAYFRVSSIFGFTGAALICLAAVYFVFFRKKWVMLAAVALPFFFYGEPEHIEKTMPNGTTVNRVYSEDGYYGNVKVVDYIYGEKHTREMMIDGLIQGGIDVKNGMSVYEYSYFLNILPYAVNPSGKNCLVLGLGTGVVPMWYEHLGIRTDVVDIDPKIAQIAARYFGFRISGDVFFSDARYFLSGPGKKYDYLIVDVFNGDTTPAHILSVEAFRLLRQRMTDRGVLAFNLIGSLDDKFVAASIVRTLREVFETVRLYPVFTPDGKEAFGNYTLLAYNFPPVGIDPVLVEKFQVHPLAQETVRKNFAAEYIIPQDTPAMTLSDDYNPIDFFDLKSKEKVRKTILESTDWDILI